MKKVHLALLLLLISYGFDILLQSILYCYLTLETMYWMHWISLLFSLCYSLAVIRLAKGKD